MNGHLSILYRQNTLSITCFTHMEHRTVRGKLRIVNSIRKCRFRGFCCVFLNLGRCFTLFRFFCCFLCCRGCLYNRRLLLLILCISGAGTYKSHTENQYAGQKDCFYFTHRLPLITCSLFLLVHSIRSMLYINLLDSFNFTKTCDLSINTVKLTGSLEHA